MKRYAHIIGTGSGVPAKVLTNDDLEKMVDTSDEWITSRTGIKKRHIGATTEASSDVATIAARNAIEAAGISVEDIDLILLGTVTPDKPLPSTACIVQDNLKAINAAVLDIVAACSGFVYGLSIAKAMIEAEQAKTVLVIGAEILSKLVNWNDRNTCVLFGDGAGAAIVQGSNRPGGIIGTYMKSNGSLWNLLTVPAGGSRMPINEENIHNGYRYIHMAGQDVYKNAVKAMGEAGIEVLSKTGLGPEDISLMIPHQANMRIIESTANRLNLPMDKVYVNIQEYGNTSAASIPIAFDEAVRSGRIKNGDVIVVVGFGGGLTWGAAVIKWNKA
jgi:3-oxoacyl-[acyl-carrier-protein] synthase III